MSRCNDILNSYLSFSCLLIRWNYHRISGGRGKEQVWHHDNFLRGMPEYMKRMVRTKIKGDSKVDSSSSSDLNFDNLPSLPICTKQPSYVLDEMEKAVLKMKMNSSSSSIDHRDDSMMPPTLLHTSVNDATNERISLQGSDSPCEFNLSLSLGSKQSYVLPPSNDSQRAPSTCSRPPILADTCKSMAHTNQASFKTTYQDQYHQRTVSYESRDPLSHCDEDLEPLSWVENDSCLNDDFANFIEGAIQAIEG